VIQARFVSLYCFWCMGNGAEALCCSDTDVCLLATLPDAATQTHDIVKRPFFGMFSFLPTIFGNRVYMLPASPCLGEEGEDVFEHSCTQYILSRPCCAHQLQSSRSMVCELQPAGAGAVSARLNFNLKQAVHRWFRGS
jgi:hypothetical protein